MRGWFLNIVTILIALEMFEAPHPFIGRFDNLKAFDNQVQFEA